MKNTCDGTSFVHDTVVQVLDQISEKTIVAVAGNLHAMAFYLFLFMNPTNSRFSYIISTTFEIQISLDLNTTNISLKCKAKWISK